MRISDWSSDVCSSDLTVLARFLTGQILGVVFGQAAGGALIEASDWRAVFVILGCAYVVVEALLWRELASGRIQHVADRRKGGAGRGFRASPGMPPASPTRPALAARVLGRFRFFRGAA